MRLTVGPLPPAVYWRRRAVVLGGFFVVILVMVYSCGGSGGSGSKRSAGPTSSPTVTTFTTVSPTVGVTPTEDLVPTDEPVGGGETPGNPGGEPEQTTTPAVGPAPAPDATACTDAEMLVTPVPMRASAPRGAPIELHLKIKNVGTRNCRRDVGADLQELRIVNGAAKIWSSDDCGAPRGSDVRWFAPSFEREYKITWNGQSSSTCKNNKPGGEIPPAGKYQLLGRLGTRLSNPVQLTLT